MCIFLFQLVFSYSSDKFAEVKLLDHMVVSFLFFKKILFMFRERGKEEEREAKKHQCVVASCAPPTGDLACNPGIALTGNWTGDPSVLRPALSPLSHTSQGEFLIFWGASILFSTVTAPLYIPKNSAQRLVFLYILASTCFLYVYNSHSSKCEVRYSLWAWFAFLCISTTVMLSTFSCTCGLSVCLLWKNVYSDLLPIF